ncbi:MAG: hypothetical protein ACD_84C00036G0003 [uncultured bacterium]|nr:MAG: hypothetical protein ACD_84C00036G0003 [uncultured bacterium]
MKQYHDLMHHILENGTKKADRTGTGTISVFGHQMRFDLSKGFPLVTTKKCHLKSIIHELLWFLQGDTNTKYLKENGVSIWDAWADSNGDLGPIYGKQWRSWEAADGTVVDQIKTAVERLKSNPDCRRNIVTAWNPGELDKMALAPCHCFFQFYTVELTIEERLALVSENFSVHYHSCVSLSCNCDKEITDLLDKANAPSRKLCCQLYQRSTDVLLGLPFNIASYALLTMMIAQVTNMVPGEFIHTSGDTHLYSNHMEQVNEQLSRELRELPVMEINKNVTSIFDFKYEDFTLTGYDPHPAISAPVAV